MTFTIFLIVNVISHRILKVALTNTIVLNQPCSCKRRIPAQALSDEQTPVTAGPPCCGLENFSTLAMEERYKDDDSHMNLQAEKHCHFRLLL